MISNKPYAQTWKWVTGSTCYKNAMEAWLLAIDGNDNVYAVGDMFPGTTLSIFGTDTVLGRQETLVSTDSNGHYRWTLSIPVLALSSAGYSGLVADHDNVYAVGNFFMSMTLDGHSLSTPWGGSFCAKVNSSGHVVWLKKVCDSSTINGIAIDKAGNLYLAGGFQQAVATIGTTHLVNADATASTDDALIVKMDSAGNVQWATRFGSGGHDLLNAIAVDHNNASYVAGTFGVAPMTVGSSTLTGSFGAALGVVAKISATGAPVWGEQVTGRDVLLMNAICVDGVNNVYLAGGCQGNVVFGSDSVTSPSTVAPFFLASYNSAGNVRWATSKGAEYQMAQSVVADACYNVWISGGIRELVIKDTMFIFRFDSSGNSIDSIIAPTGGDDQSGLVVDNRGNMFVCGDAWTSYRTDTFMFGSDSLIIKDSTQETLFLAKLSYPTCPGMIKTEVPELIAQAIMPRLYPNPTDDECTIDAGEGTSLHKADIYDMAGRLITSYPLSGAKATISVGGVSPGLYTCIITTADNKRYANKLAVVR